MKNVIFLILAVTLLAYTSCKKDPFENKTIIEGHILEYGSEKPLPNVRIYLQRLDGPAYGPYHWTVVDSIFTDANGYVHYEFNHNEGTIDKCTFKTPNRYYKIDFAVVNSSRVNDISRSVIPYAWVNVHVKNVNPFNTSDLIRYNISGGGESYFLLWNGYRFSRGSPSKRK